MGWRRRLLNISYQLCIGSVRVGLRVSGGREHDTAVSAPDRPASPSALAKVAFGSYSHRART